MDLRSKRSQIVTKFIVFFFQTFKLIRNYYENSKCLALSRVLCGYIKKYELWLLSEILQFIDLYIYIITINIQLIYMFIYIISKYNVYFHKFRALILHVH